MTELVKERFIYIRLTELVPKLLEIVDEKLLAFRSVAEVPYLTVEELERLENLFAQRNLSEVLKTSDPLAWTNRKNCIKKQAEELVLEQIIFA